MAPRQSSMDDGEGDLFQRGSSDGKRKVRKPMKKGGKKNKNDDESLSSGLSSDSDSDDGRGGVSAEAPARVELLRYSVRPIHLRLT
jgi:hypothetical protein